MRVVLDTNIIVCGILSPAGAARALLELARGGRIEAVTSLVLLDELEEVLARFSLRSIAAEIQMMTRCWQQRSPVRQLVSSPGITTC